MDIRQLLEMVLGPAESLPGHRLIHKLLASMSMAEVEKRLDHVNKVMTEEFPTRNLFTQMRAFQTEHPELVARHSESSKLDQLFQDWRTDRVVKIKSRYAELCVQTFSGVPTDKNEWLSLLESA